ncbi:MAG: peptidoglycan bridge formation glycyltransferase FemA/FemB family protein [Patescibacteria group bacterium]
MIKIESQFDMVNSWLKEDAEDAPFNQSYEWEEILSREGKEIERLAILDNETPVAEALVEYHRLPFGWRYAFCARGPVFKKNVECRMLNEAYRLIAEYLKIKKCIFLRFEPANTINDPHTKFSILHSVDINPRATFVLDLRQTPEDLLNKMHPKTRYNIHLAERKGLVVKDDKDADLFMRLMRETAKRDKFRLHVDRHYHEIIFSPMSRQLTVYYQATPIASAVFTGFGDTFTYLFGASDYNYRSLMAPYLIQWEGIKTGQRSGYRFYDFFGVAPKVEKASGEEYEYNAKHQYAGVSRFKQGFGGEYREQPGTFDLIISPRKYKLYKLLRALRRLL